MLAHYLTSALLPLCDVVIDLHSGGRSLDCLPSTMSHILDDLAAMRRAVELARAFEAPLHVMNREVDGSQTFAAAVRRGITYISSELGGGNRMSLDGLAIARRGIRNAMIHVGVLRGRPMPSEVSTRLMMIPTPHDYGFAPTGGIYAPCRPLGAAVAADERIGEILCIEDPLAPPVPVQAVRDGLLWCQRGQGRIAAGGLHRRGGVGEPL
jgi:N-alpha-acetyl-L-2,4-diaminobutyrate deacetylase